MNLKNLIQKIKGPKEILAAALAIAFVFSLAGRLLPYRKGSQKTVLYVEELLLGPKTERSRPIFSPGTKLDFCFGRDKVLYVGLTPALLEKTGNASEIMAGIELFKKNIRSAFPKYKQIEIYIDKKGLIGD